MNLQDLLKNNSASFHPVVPFNATAQKLLMIDFTENNKELAPDILNDLESFISYINNKLIQANASYGIGGYDEYRGVYSASKVFDATHGAEPRRLHLGIDIWAPGGTPVYAPLPAIVHSFSFNDAFGDYGATLILQHQLEDAMLYTLYGHLSLASIVDKQEGQVIQAGDWIAAFGAPHENGNWPPHLHFQIIRDLGGMKGDYPGVCALSERKKYLANCPDPDLILQMIKFAN